jgi:hypothetical protein
MNFDHIRDHSHTIGTRRYFRYRPDDWRVVCATCGNGGSVIHKTREAAGHAAARDSGKVCKACGAS